MRKPPARRPYDATRRRQKAEETRERVLEAARSLFASRGYAETTIDAIAAEAEVAAPTVYAIFRSKHGVLSALMARLVSGEPGSAQLLETEGARAVLEPSDPRRVLELFVDHLNQVQRRMTETYDAMKSAARSEPDVARLLSRAQAERLSNVATVPRRLAELDALRPGLSLDDASRTIWAIGSQETRQLLREVAGWSEERYRRWLLDTLSAILLRPGRAVERRSR